MWTYSNISTPPTAWIWFDTMNRWTNKLAGTLMVVRAEAEKHNRMKPDWFVVNWFSFVRWQAACIFCFGFLFYSKLSHYTTWMKTLLKSPIILLPHKIMVLSQITLRYISYYIVRHCDTEKWSSIRNDAWWFPVPLVRLVRSFWTHYSIIKFGPTRSGSVFHTTNQT